MINLGDFPASHTAVCIPWDSFAGATGASSAASNFAAGDVLIFKNGGTTQRSSSAGITASTTFDSQTGLQMIVIDLSDNTDAGFYAAGNEYQVAVADVTIDSQTVRFWAGCFSIERAGGTLSLLKGANGVAAIKTDTAAVKVQTDKLTFTVANVLDANTLRVGGTVQTARDVGASVLLSSGTGTGQLKLASGYVAMTWADVAAPTTTVNLSGTTISTTQKVDVETIKTQTVTAAAGVTFPTSIASPTNITAGTITTATNLTNAPTSGDFTATMKTSIGTAVAASAVASVTGNVGGNLAGTIGGLTAAALKDFFDTDSTTTYGSAVAGSVVKELADNAGGSALTTDAIMEAMFTYDATAELFTADPGSVVRQIVFGSAPSFTVGDIADEVETRTIAAVTVVNGLAANVITAAATAADFTTEIQTGLATAANLATVLADTNELQTDWVNGGRLDNILDARASQTSVDDLPTNAELATALGTADDAVLAAVATRASQTSVDTVDDLLDTELPALTTAVGAIKTQTDKLAFTVTNKVDANTLAINGDATAAATSAILNGANVVYRGTVTGGATTTTLRDSGLTQADADWLKGRIVLFTSVIPLQATDITAFDPATDELTFTAVTQAPTGATYCII